MKKRLFCLLFFLWALLLACSGCEPTQPETLDKLYRGAVADAVFADVDEICDDLVAITQENDDIVWDDDMVLVVTFTQFPESYPVGENVQTWWGQTWVTAVPELQTFFEDTFGFFADPLLRIEQLLGLPPDSGNRWFAELWVNPEDLFRPCPDCEITDSTCGIRFPDNATDEHIEWYNNQILESYFQEQKYPWTRLGYTYDWGKLNDEVGLSEFVIQHEAEVRVERLVKFDEYLP